MGDVEEVAQIRDVGGQARDQVRRVDRGAPPDGGRDQRRGAGLDREAHAAEDVVVDVSDAAAAVVALPDAAGDPVGLLAEVAEGFEVVGVLRGEVVEVDSVVLGEQGGAEGAEVGRSVTGEGEEGEGGVEGGVEGRATTAEERHDSN